MRNFRAMPGFEPDSRSEAKRIRQSHSEDNMGWSGWEKFDNLTTYEKNQRTQS